MAMTSGTRLGPYEIVSSIGAGGMGEVYRARDTKLDRDVAIKVLPADLAKDPDALSRLEREARAVAQLSHPNILAIFDFGREGETAYAVMELLEGETLRARLTQGALPARKAVDLAVQMAEGLAAAHEKGIVHRDLKPENVFVTGEGRVKLLDFGLAKKMSLGLGGGSHLQTLERQTDAGTVMGTVGYMSPEQVRGEVADHRSAIFSFGAVLYEMLSGRRAFGRDTAAESMTAILKEDPPEIAASEIGASAGLQRIVQHCLEKKPGERFQSARDVAFALQALSGSAVTSGPLVADARRWSRLWLIVAVVAVVMGAVGLASYRRGDKAGMRSASGVRFRQVSFQPQMIWKAAFAPDGETIVYSAANEGKIPDLFVIRPEYPAPQSLGLPHTQLLSISSRGELAVLTNLRHALSQNALVGTLARVALGGTAPRDILEGVRLADWLPDGSDLAIVRAVGGTDRVEYPIGKVLCETPGYFGDLRASPRGDRIALTEHHRQGDDRGSVLVVDRSGKRTTLSEEYSSISGLAWSQTGDEILFSASPAGTARTIYRVDLAGRIRVALATAGRLIIHDVSHTGRWIVAREDYRSEIAVSAPGAGGERKLAWLDASDGPLFSRDGSMLLFTDWSEAGGLNYETCLQRTAGGPVLRLGEGGGLGFSPDGKLALALINTPPQLVIYPIGAGTARRLPQGALAAYIGGGWFPDGRRVLVVGNEAGKASRCYAQDLVGGLPRALTEEGTTSGRVSSDGLQILCRGPDGNWLIQPVNGEKARPVPLTSEDDVIDWSADGRSVLIYRGQEIPITFERLDLASGRRVLIRKGELAEKTGFLASFAAAVSEDARSFAYSYYVSTAQLFVVEGAR